MRNTPPKSLSILTGAVVFGWMVFAGASFLLEGHAPSGSLVLTGFDGFPLEAATALAASVWLLIVFAGTGYWLLYAIGLRDLRPLDAFAAAAALGMGVWGLLVLALGLAGLLFRPLLLALPAAATAASLPPLIATWRKWKTAPPQRPRGAVEWSVVALAAVGLLLGLIYTLTPAVQSDGLRYHLAAPEVYLRDHRITYLPFNAFTNFPFLIEMLFTLGLAAGGEMAAKAVHFECFILCGLLLAAISRRLHEHEPEEAGRQAGIARALRSMWLAPTVFWTTPTALITAAWEFIDLGTAMYLAATIYALVRWHREPDSRSKARWRLLAGLFLGLLIGTKYTMAAVAAFVPIVILFELPSFSPGGRWDAGYWVRSSLIVGLIAGAVAAPWFAKNAAFTGNPVYPLAWGVFDGGEWNEANARFYYEKSGLKGHHARYDRNFVQILRHVIVTPWDATIHWRENLAEGRPGYEDHFLGPVFLLWLPLLLGLLMDLKHRRPAEGPLRIVLLVAAAYCALWFFTYQSNRLLIPAAAAFSVLVAWSLVVVGRTARWVAGGALIVLFAACLYNLAWSAEWVFRETRSKSSAYSYLAGLESRDRFVQRAFPPYGAFQLMTQHVGDGERVLFVGEFRGLHCPVDRVASDWFDTPRILDYIRKSGDNDTLLDRLLAEGIRWVFLNRTALRQSAARYFGLSPEGVAELRALDNAHAARYIDLYARPLFSAREKGRLGELVGPIEPGAPGAVHRRLRNVFSMGQMELYEIVPR